MKFHSSRLKKYDYNITIDYQQALDNGEIINLADNQILRTIRKVVIDKTDDKKSIEKRILNRDLLEEFYIGLNRIKKQKNSKQNEIKMKQLKDKIVNMCFIPEYITIVIDHPTHYEKLYEYGLVINGIVYFRLSTSAGQGRVSTVTFCSSDVLETVNEILDNGRNKDKVFSPSKFNAYKGTYGSATKVVSTPRFCVVPDYFSDDTFTVNFVTETKGEVDDNIEEQKLTRSYNR